MQLGVSMAGPAPLGATAAAPLSRTAAQRPSNGQRASERHHSFQKYVTYWAKRLGNSGHRVLLGVSMAGLTRLGGRVAVAGTGIANKGGRNGLLGASLGLHRRRRPVMMSDE